MFKFNHLLSVSTLTLISFFIPQKNVNAITINKIAEGFTEGATYTGFVTGKDLNNDGTLVLEELVNWGASFTGNSIIPAYSLTSANANLVSTQSNFSDFEYVYGVSLLDTADDISLSYTVFLKDNINELFISIETENDYSGIITGNTKITHFNNFLNQESSDTTSETMQLTTVPEPITILGSFAFGVFCIGSQIKRKQ